MAATSATFSAAVRVARNLEADRLPPRDEGREASGNGERSPFAALLPWGKYTIIAPQFLGKLVYIGVVSGILAVGWTGEVDLFLGRARFWPAERH